MHWLFLEPPTHLLEKTDAPFTQQTRGKHRPGLCMHLTKRDACLWGFSVEHFPAACCRLSHPSCGLALQFSSCSSGTHCPFCALRRGSKGTRPQGAITPGCPLHRRVCWGSCLLGCFCHHKSLFFNSLPVVSFMKTGIETSMFSFHYILELPD